MSYECYIFAWEDEPEGGANDLIWCAETLEEGMEKAKKLSKTDEYSVVQLMRKDGSSIYY